uniref:Uncharacterized protein n=1 Tax=Ixodes ricinus TaxID=34613 RepID=A0A6B0UT13_IXORI
MRVTGRPMSMASSRKLMSGTLTCWHMSHCSCWKPGTWYTSALIDWLLPPLLLGADTLKPRSTVVLFCSTRSVSVSQPPLWEASLKRCMRVGQLSRTVSSCRPSTTVVGCSCLCRKSSTQSRPSTRASSSQNGTLTFFEF